MPIPHLLLAETRELRLPLPGGEGWGEGELVHTNFPLAVDGGGELQNRMHTRSMNQRHRSAADLGCGFWQRLAASSDPERDAR